MRQFEIAKLNGEFIRQKMTALVLDKENNQLRITFESGRTVTIYDDEQRCCEYRYMSTDDDLSQFVGATFLGYEVRDAPNIDDDCEEHEVQFLVILTDRGNISFANHNEHNGYYGGFKLIAIVDQPRSARVRFDEILVEDVMPFDAKLTVGDKVVGTINGTFNRNALVSGFFAQIAQYEDNDPRLVVSIVALAERMLRSWDLEETPGVPAEFSRLWDMPPAFVAQIVAGMFAAANGEPPSYLRGLM
jgi:hypothetical protein